MIKASTNKSILNSAIYWVLEDILPPADRNQVPWKTNERQDIYVGEHIMRHNCYRTRALGVRDTLSNPMCDLDQVLLKSESFI
jgi:hypothetical protein